jgi:ribonuclease/clavin/mitogillin
LIFEGWGTSWLLDLHEYMNSLSRMRDVRPTRVYPAHGPLIEDGEMVMNRYMTHRNARERQVWRLLVKMSEPMTAATLAQQLYPNLEVGSQKLTFAEENVFKILRKLEKDGAVQVFSGPFFAGSKKIVPAYLSWHARGLQSDLLWAAKGRSGCCVPSSL